MALQTQFALRKFIVALALFILSVIFFALSEYHIFISTIIVVAVAIMSRKTYLHLIELVGFFQLNPEVTVTGQWDLTGRIDRFGRDLSGSTQRAGGGRPTSRAIACRPGEPEATFVRGSLRNGRDARTPVLG